MFTVDKKIKSCGKKTEVFFIFKVCVRQVSTTSQKRSAIACVVSGSQSFYLLHTHAFIHERNVPFHSQPKLVFIFTEPRGMKGWVGLGTTTVSKQSAQDRYVTDIAVVSCSNRHASLDKRMCTASAHVRYTGAKVKVSLHIFAGVTTRYTPGQIKVRVKCRDSLFRFLSIPFKVIGKVTSELGALRIWVRSYPKAMRRSGVEPRLQFAAESCKLCTSPNLHCVFCYTMYKDQQRPSLTK